jgi:hypothetical protein
MNGHNRKNMIMSLDSFRLEDLVILLAVGWFGGLIVAGHLSVRSKRSEATAMTDRDPRAISRNASLSQKENISIGEK